MSFPVLTIILLMPILGAVISIFVPKEKSALLKGIAGLTTLISLALTIYIYYLYYTQHLAAGGLCLC